jgi:hypothetical protein
MGYQWSSAKKIFSGIKGYDYWMKTAIKINQFDKSEIDSTYGKYSPRIINSLRETSGPKPDEVFGYCKR